jgi:hypothetical protein
MAENEGNDTRAMLRWTMAAVLASWALNLLIFWIAQAQHQDARELLQVQVGAVLDEEFNSQTLRHERGRLAAAIYHKDWPEDDRVLQFFDKAGMYLHQGRVDEDTLYEQFDRPVEYYWTATQHYVQELRKSRHDDLLFANFEELYHQFARRSARTNGGQAPAHTDQELGNFLDEERVIDPSQQAGEPPGT